MKFEQLNLIEPIKKALNEKQYFEPTPIQKQSIPIVLEGYDLQACAQTGTGKTAAFAIPTIQNLYFHNNKQNTKEIQALILTPTRELAIQIDENIKLYAKNTNISNAVIFGGVKQGSQVSSLEQGANILVATPGRLLDLINQKIISLNKIKIFVLDESDRMLDMGFINDVKKIIKLLPQKRQSLFFSATLPDKIISLAKTILNKPKFVEVTPVSSTASKVTQLLYYTNKPEKIKLLFHLLKSKKPERVLLFCKTKYGADKVVKHLKKNNFNAAAIHGNKTQNQRQRALNQFKTSDINILVATDIAARGIDIDELPLVINYDIPSIPETYVHRIGRTGRAGKDGEAISICEPEEIEFIKDIQKLIELEILVEDNHPFPQTDKPMNKAERKEFEAQKRKRKQEFFANRKNNQNKRR